MVNPFMSKFCLIFVHPKKYKSMDIDNLLRFLSELKVNNNREWFAENKVWYDQVRAEFEQVCKEVIAAISSFDEEIKRVEVKECTFRIYRDIRFSNDKTPYKTHFGVYIASEGGRKSQRAGYYLHLEPTGSFLSCGVWYPDSNMLKALRQSVYDNIDELNEIMSNPDFSQNFNGFYEEDKLKTVPRGFPKDFPAGELLKLKHYLVDHPLDNAILHAPDFGARVAEIAKCAFPFNRFLNFTVDEVVKGKK